MKRVSFDDLDSSDDGYADILLDDQLFEGIATDVDRKTNVKVETGYSRGKLHGPNRSWYPTGAIKSEEFFRRGGRHGAWREWSPSGQLLHEEIWQYARPLATRRWDETGTVLEDVNLLIGNTARQESWLERRLERGPLGIVELENDEFVEKPWPFDDLIPAELAARITP